MKFKISMLSLIGVCLLLFSSCSIGENYDNQILDVNNGEIYQNQPNKFLISNCMFNESIEISVEMKIGRANSKIENIEKGIVKFMDVKESQKHCTFSNGFHCISYKYTNNDIELIINQKESHYNGAFVKNIVLMQSSTNGLNKCSIELI